MTETAGTWSAGVEAQLPGNANANQNVDVNQVSCASPGNCTAIGDYKDTSGNFEGLLLAQTGGTWSAGVEAPLPAGAATTSQSVNLPSVSCVAAGNCTAVGSYVDGAGHSQALLLTEISGAWAQGIVAPLPADAAPNPNASLSSVSCAAAGNCTAVGRYTNGSGNSIPLLLTETSGTWAPGAAASLPANLPATGQSVNFLSVSCVSAGNCSAGGYYVDTSGGNQGLLLNQVAGVWGPAIGASLPANASTTLQNASLSSVSCVSAGACMAVGAYSDSSANREGLLVSEASGTWGPGLEASLPANAATIGPTVNLNSVSCVSAGNCSAVGYYSVTNVNRHGVLLTTAPFQPGVTVSAPATGTSGSPIAASSVAAVLTGGSAATGTIAFTLFGPQSSAPSSCASGGTPVGSATVAGDGSYHPAAAFTPAKPGNYWWYASYSGDGGNDPEGSACGASMPDTVITAPPVITAPLIVKIATKRATVISGKAGIRLVCSGGAVRASCQGKLTLTVRRRVVRFVHHRRKVIFKTITLAGASYRMPRGTTKTIELPLTSAAVLALHNARGHHLVALATATQQSGHPATGNVTLQLPRTRTRR